NGSRSGRDGRAPFALLQLAKSLQIQAAAVRSRKGCVASRSRRGMPWVRVRVVTGRGRGGGGRKTRRLAAATADGVRWIMQHGCANVDQRASSVRWNEPSVGSRVPLRELRVPINGIIRTDAHAGEFRAEEIIIVIIYSK